MMNKKQLVGAMLVFLIIGMQVQFSFAAKEQTLGRWLTDAINKSKDKEENAQGFVSDDKELIEEIFRTNETVDVIVWLNGNEYTKPDYQEDIERKKQEIRDFEEDFLSELDSDSINVKYLYKTTNGFAATITREDFDKIKGDSRVSAVILDREVSGTLAESRALVNASAVETNYGLNGSGSTVCVVDSGIDYNHPALGGGFGPGFKVLGGFDFINNDTNPMDDNGHGTSIAGIVASSDANIRGIAPGANLAAVKVLGAANAGPWSAIAAGVDWCVDNKNQYNIKIITLSVGDGGGYNATNCPSFIDPSLQNAFNAGIFIDAASGNEGWIGYGVAYPACNANVVSVGATYDANVGPVTWSSAWCTDQSTYADKIACGTTRGENLDLLAPGALITSTASSTGNICGGGSGLSFGTCFGTSQAAPHVAGAAALLLQANPLLTPVQIESILKLTGRPIFDQQSGMNFKRLDVLNAITNQNIQSQPIVHLNGNFSRGTTVYINVEDFSAPNKQYLVGLALNSTPATVIPGGQTVNLTSDELLVTSIFNPNAIGLVNSQGILNGAGQNTASIYIPDIPSLAGRTIYVAFVTYDSNGVISVSPTRSFVIL